VSHPWVHYLPVLTTAIAATFFVVMLRAALIRRTGPHLAWWAFGVFAYGLGTLVEASITLAGNSVALTKAWYIAGALLGGYPLAQGAVYLHLRRRTANATAYATLAFVAFAACMVVLSPVDIAHLDPQRPQGALLAWHWVRWLTPFINLYAFVFLVGGAALSAVRFRKGPRVLGNILIAIGALLPGIGGGLAKTGFVEALYVLELAGLILIWIGYGVMVRARPAQDARP